MWLISQKPLTPRQRLRLKQLTTTTTLIQEEKTKTTSTLFMLSHQTPTEHRVKLNTFITPSLEAY